MNMVSKEDTKIIEAEIDRLDKAYRNAQDRYAYSGSASTDRTMYKYQVLQRALEGYLNNNADASKERMILRQQDQLYRIKTVVERLRGTEISYDAATALRQILMEA